MKILTISIAAYNVEKFLDETLKSICNQKYITDIEVLIIDDGSKDRTEEIGNRYQKLYPYSVKYVKKENGGHGSTINKGIELATGKYFRVVDGDDYVETEAFEKYIQKLKTCDSDLVITDYWWVDNNKNIYPHNHDVFSTIPVEQELFSFENLDSSLWGLSTLCIKTELLKNSGIRITEKCFYVDVEFVIWAIFLAKSSVFYNLKVYMYRCITTTHNSVHKANMIKNVAMQKEVALKLCMLFEKFKNMKTMDNAKRGLILNRIQMSIGATYRTYLLCDKYKEKIRDFDEKILKSSKDVYEHTSKNMFVKCIRMANYIFVPIVGLTYKFYLTIKKVK